MAQRLFAVGKIPVFLDNYTPGTERRRGETVKVLKLTMRVQPFDSKLASAIDDGINDDAGVKDALFKASNGEPKKHRNRVNFSMGCTQQNLIIYASSDTETSRMAFTQCRIGGEYARTSKDVNAYAFVFTATFGPVGRDEMEFVHAWMGTQRSVTFEESEEQIDFDADAEPDTEYDEDDMPKGVKAGPKAPTEPPMFGDEEQDASAPGKKVVADKNREVGHNYPKKKAKKAAKKGKK